jgi:hypothetical protein
MRCCLAARFISSSLSYGISRKSRRPLVLIKSLLLEASVLA